jgi:transposase InsO family protein
MKDAKKAWPVAWMCKRLDVSRSGYYAWLERGPSERARRDQRLAVSVAAIHAESGGVYGSPRIHDELVDNGEQVGRKRVARLMSERGLSGVAKRAFKRTTDSMHTLPVAENLVQRRFVAERPDQLWVADISYISTWEGFLYLAVILDVFSRRVVGWAVADHMRTELVLEALDKAVVLRRPSRGLVVHSDRGVQYASHAHQAALRKHGMICSMSRKGNCWDNAVAESFFATLKQELIYRSSWPTKVRAKAAIEKYIVDFYNAWRRHSTLGGVSPVKYEAAAREQARAA